MFAPARWHISRTVAARKPTSAKTSPAASSRFARVSAWEASSFIVSLKPMFQTYISNDCLKCQGEFFRAKDLHKAKVFSDFAPFATFARKNVFFQRPTWQIMRHGFKVEGWAAVCFSERGYHRRWQDRAGEPAFRPLRQQTRPGPHAGIARHGGRSHVRRAHGGLEPRQARPRWREISRIAPQAR